MVTEEVKGHISRSNQEVSLRFFILHVSLYICRVKNSKMLENLGKIENAPNPNYKEQGMIEAKVVGTIEGATEAFCKYCQTQELFQRAWVIMS